MAIALCERAERVEEAIEAAAADVRGVSFPVSGPVRITTTDVLLHAALLPALPGLMALYPGIQLEIDTHNHLVNLTQREADIALRPTTAPPEHMVGRPLRVLKQGVAMSKFALGSRTVSDVQLRSQTWLTPAGPIGDHASGHWRKTEFGDVPELRITSMTGLIAGVYAGAGLGVIPHLAFDDSRLVWLLPDIEALKTELWLLHHPHARRTPRIQAVFSHLADALAA